MHNALGQTFWSGSVVSLCPVQEHKSAHADMCGGGMQVVQASPIVAKSAGSRAKKDIDTESTVSEGSSCHPSLSTASAVSTPAATADSDVIPADRPLPEPAGPRASPGKGDDEETALSNEQSNGGVSGQSEDDDMLEYSPRHGTVTHSCLLILLEVGPQNYLDTCGACKTTPLRRCASCYVSCLLDILKYNPNL